MDINKQIKSVVNEGYVSAWVSRARHPIDNTKDIYDYNKGGFVDKSKILGRHIKNTVKDAIEDNPRTAGAVAGASGVIGAGLMAKKYLADKLKAKK